MKKSTENILVNKIFSRSTPSRTLLMKECFEFLGCPNNLVGVDLFSSVACVISPSMRVSPSRVLVCANIGDPRLLVVGRKDGLLKATKIGNKPFRPFGGLKMVNSAGVYVGDVVNDYGDVVTVRSSDNYIGRLLFPFGLRKTRRSTRVYSRLAAADSGPYLLCNLVSDLLENDDRLVFNVHALGYSSLHGVVSAVGRIRPLVVLDIGAFNVEPDVISPPPAMLEVSEFSNQKLIDMVMDYIPSAEIKTRATDDKDLFSAAASAAYLKINFPVFSTGSGKYVELERVRASAEALLGMCIRMGSIDLRV